MVFVVLFILADLAMILPLTTWNLLDFRVADKKNCYCKGVFVRVVLVITIVVSFSCNSPYFESY